MFTGGLVPISKPSHPMECVKHGLPLQRLISGTHEIWTCAGCNTEVIDGWSKQASTITIQIPRA